MSCSCCNYAYLAGLSDGLKLGFKAGYCLGHQDGYVSGYLDAAENRMPLPEYKPLIQPRLPETFQPTLPARFEPLSLPSYSAFPRINPWD